MSFRAPQWKHNCRSKGVHVTAAKAPSLQHEGYPSEKQASHALQRWPSWHPTQKSLKAEDIYRQPCRCSSLLQGRPSSRLSLLAEAPISEMTPHSIFQRYPSREYRPSSRAAQLAAQGALPPAQQHRRALCSQQEKDSAVEPCPLCRACQPGWPSWQQKRGSMEGEDNSLVPASQFAGAGKPCLHWRSN